VVVYCPIAGITLGDDLRTFEAEDGVKVSKPTRDEQLIFLSQYHHEFLEDEDSSWLSRVIVEIEHDFSPPSSIRMISPAEEHAITASVASTLDRLKWALMLSGESTDVVEEGPVIIRGPAGFRARTLRRSDLPPSIRSYKPLHVNEEISQRTIAYIKAFKEAERRSRELALAMWCFGRTCTTYLSRDILLDAVFGLEMLLVPDPGESTYKFSLHGAALLGDTGDGAIAKELREMYGGRSRLAHGSTATDNSTWKMAQKARRLLADAIWAVVRRINNGSLNVTETNGDIGKAVGNLVRRMVVLAARQTQEPTKQPHDSA
jgi:hypothetical protein